MIVDWYLYEGLIGNGTSGNKRESAINDSVNAFISGMVDDPGYQEYSKVNGIITPIVASRKSTIMCEIKAPPETSMHIGDMVECFEEHWIIVELHTDKVGIINGEMWLCNSILRFQNKTASIISRHCVVDDGTYSKKNSNPDVYVMTNTYKVYLTIDSDTKRLFVDKRLSFGQIYSSDGEIILEVYKIIGIDVKSKNFGSGSHLMVLTVQRDVYDPRVDSLKDNICDLIIENSDSSNPQPSGSCVINGRESIRIGTTRKYTTTFTDSNGNVITDAIPRWSITAQEGIKYNTSGVECAISVPLDEKYVGETIIINVTDENNAFGQYEKKVQVMTVG